MSHRAKYLRDKAAKKDSWNSTTKGDYAVPQYIDIIQERLQETELSTYK